MRLINKNRQCLTSGHAPCGFHSNLQVRFPQGKFVTGDSFAAIQSRPAHNILLNGGHFIPNEDVIRRYDRSKRNFWNIYKNYADEWELYYNGKDEFIQVALGSKIEYRINDEDLFNLFMRNISI